MARRSNHGRYGARSFPDTLLALDGEVGRLIAKTDWARTPMGPIDAWPPSLKTSLGLILMSPTPIVLLWGPDGIMLYNDAYSVFAGGRHPRLLGSKVREGWPEVAAFNDHVMNVGLAGGCLSYRDQELTLHRSGMPEQVWMNLDYSPVPGDDGLAAGVVAIVVETTERVLIERRQEFLLDLEARLRAETDPGTVLDVAVEALGKHLGANRVGYSQVHGDGETVTLMSCYADGVEPLEGSYRLDAFGPDSIRRQREGALQSAERARTLVQRLLAFARRQPLQATAVNVAQLVTGMAGLVESTLGPKIAIRLDLAPDLPPARADANQLEMALLNLAVNARDAMPQGGTLSITAAPERVEEGARRDLAPGAYLRLAVADSGIGMSEETMRRAIEPFFSTKGIGKGTGLGLSMVHGLAAQLGGAMAIASEPGSGTTVELWLPVSAEAPAGDAADVRNAEVVGTRGRALLVDDEELVRMSTADMLMDLGFVIVEAGSAEEALRLLKQGERPDLIVTDHLMPGMRGAELAQEVRAFAPELPILIVSGYADAEGIAPDLPRLTKPFKNAELAQSLEKLNEPHPG